MATKKGAPRRPLSSPAGASPAPAAAPQPGATAARAWHGPQELGALIPRLARPAFGRRGADAARLLLDWPAIVGPEIAGLGTPVRLSAGTLTLAASGPAAMELSLLSPLVIDRVNGHFGRAAVARLGFVQRPPRASAPPAPPPAAPLPLPQAAHAALGRLPEGELREALAKLAEGVYRIRG